MRSVALDLRKFEGQAFSRRFVATADVRIDNFRPGTLEGWPLKLELHDLCDAI